MERYILIPYSEAEEFENSEGCYFIYDPIPGAEDIPIIVPEKEYCKKKGLPYPFSNTCTNGELIDLLSQFPRDAVVGIEYCSPKKLQYFKDRNFIAID